MHSRFHLWPLSWIFWRHWPLHPQVSLCFFYLWNWISSTLQTPLNLHLLENLLYILKQHVSPQLRSIRLVAIIFVIWGIWHCRDKQRFNNVVIPLHNIKIMISSFISLVGNSDLGTMGRSIDELCVFKAFNIARNLTQALLHHSSASKASSSWVDKMQLRWSYKR